MAQQPWHRLQADEALAARGPLMHFLLQFDNALRSISALIVMASGANAPDRVRYSSHPGKEHV